MATFVFYQVFNLLNLPNLGSTLLWAEDRSSGGARLGGRPAAPSRQAGPLTVEALAEAQQPLTRQLGDGIGRALPEARTCAVVALLMCHKASAATVQCSAANSTTSISASCRNRASSVFPACPSREHNTNELSTTVGAPIPTWLAAARWSRRRS
jgi:hypothetical protein